MPSHISKWRRKRREYDTQIRMHGPMWQPECNWCDWMGDVHNTPEDADRDAAKHECEVLVPIPMSEFDEP